MTARLQQVKLNAFTANAVDAFAENDTDREKEMDINIGDIVKLKKQHPCGSREWEVLRSGADFRLKCKGCGHQIMIARKLLEKNIKEIN